MAGKKGQRSRKHLVIAAKRSRVMKRGLDGRGRDARYMQAVKTQLIEDLGGRDDLSIQKLAFIEEAAFALARLRRLKTDHMAGSPFDDRAYSAMLNSIIGLFGKLGLERKAKKVLSAQELIARETSTP
jgi:hypothetical protein